MKCIFGWFSVNINDKVQFEWFAENLHNSIVNITNYDEIIINGAIKNVTSIATVVIDQKSSIRKGTVSISNLVGVGTMCPQKHLHVHAY